MKTPLTLLFLGDICPTTDNVALFESSDAPALLNSVLSKLQESDITCGNLECVLTETAQPREKVGPVLRGRGTYADFVASMGVGILGMANNHIGDCGGRGVTETITACENAGIQTLGAGENRTSAARPLVVERNGWRIGFIAVAEEEFNAATATGAGANIFDPYITLPQIRTLRARCDYLVVLYHGGIEYYRYPSPLLQKKCRAMIDCGAHLVLCQHSHCIGAREAFRDGEILYGQGNAIYGYRAGHATWNEGLLVEVRLTSSGDHTSTSLSYLPIEARQDGTVDLMPPQAKEQCLRLLHERSANLSDTTFIESTWQTFCKRQALTHLPHLVGFGPLLTRLNRVLKGYPFKLMQRRRQNLISLNVIRCDAHREVIQTALEFRCTPEKL